MGGWVGGGHVSDPFFQRCSEFRTLQRAGGVRWGGGISFSGKGGFGPKGKDAWKGVRGLAEEDLGGWAHESRNDGHEEQGVRSANTDNPVATHGMQRGGSSLRSDQTPTQLPSIPEDPSPTYNNFPETDCATAQASAAFAL